MRIVRFEAENVKRIKAVSVTPSGDLVVVGGKNDAGKSSLLDAIEMAMGGEASTPAQPVRRGQKDARVVLDLGDIVVTRTFGASGSRKLIVANKDGARFPSPQAMLDRLYGALSFDPLAFERMDPKKQAETLRQLVGLDLSVLDGKRAALYDERTQANREVKALEVNVDRLQQYPDAPAEEVSIAALAGELEAAERSRAEAETIAQRSRDAWRKVETHDARMTALDGEILSTREKLLALESARMVGGVESADLSAAALAATEAAVDALAAVPDTTAIRGRLAAAESVNAQVRTNRQRAEAASLLADAKRVAGGLSSRIEALDAERLETLAAVTFPVPGLSIDQDGVVLDGLPFAQASTSDRIRVSVGIGLASNPTFRVLLVRDGSLLGEEKLKLLATMAAEANAQVWVELLQEAPDGRTTVYIEDGSVKPKAVAKPEKSDEQLRIEEVPF